jgi:hypothetical protein
MQSQRNQQTDPKDHVYFPSSVAILKLEIPMFRNWSMASMTCR